MSESPRFAYIDSQGNEVPIPGVDALALRIELGAIGPDTQLYDANEDRWGPAHTHEIFLTLSRAKDEGFVAPPPMAPTSGTEPAEEPASMAELAPDEGAAGADDLEPIDAAGGDGGVGASPAGPDDLGLDFTLVDGGDAPAADAAGGPEPSSEAGDFGFDLVDDGPAEAPPSEAPGKDGGAMDFGFEGGLELEGNPFEDAPPSQDPGGGTMDFGGLGVEEPADLDGGLAPDSGYGGGMELEQPLSASDPGSMDFGGDAGGGLELEQPMSEFSADDPPGWMDAGGDDTVGSGMDFSQDEPEEEAAPVAGDADAAPPQRRTPPTRSRPSPPRRPQKRSFAGPIMAVLALGVVGVGGWFGWQALQNRAEREEDEGPVRPAVVIPDIPVELLPQMRDMGEAALSATIRELQALQAEFDIAAEPNGDWLAGVYLANASQFRDVQEYWEALEQYVDRVRELDTQVFHDQYVAQLEEAGVAGDTAAILLERADSGFMATQPDRFEVYAQMDDLIVAALDLHRFLLSNEGNIAYEPAAGGVSRDPILEAVPSSEALGDEMWAGVDRITQALDQLGTLDRVTTERLVAVLFDRIRRAGFQ